MPRTLFQRILFTLATVTFSVVVFVLYNIAIASGGMRNAVFQAAWSEILLEFPFAFLGQFLVAGPLSARLAFRVVDPRVDHPRLVVLAITFMTIPLMCPYMSLVSVVLHRGFTGELASQWLQAVAFNLPLAFFAQFLLIGPVVRFAFRRAWRIPSPPPGLSRALG